MIYRGIIKTRTKSTKLSIRIIVLFMMIFEFFTRKFVYIPITAIVLAASFLNKEHLVSPNGINIQYEWLGKIIDTTWPWTEVTAVAYDDIKARPDIYFYFGKGMTTRSFLMKGEQFSEILQLIHRERPDLNVENIANN